ncbi:hypothetical protein [Alteromonas sp. 14N.309.X.WAT.G.H12]|uniref:hypothetical protein n=1 Tax=Alteromonas sp. 14N.309.X.WAT.G.H12 TaxID=3120824 RepID=UPI002FD4E4B5
MKYAIILLSSLLTSPFIQAKTDHPQDEGNVCQSQGAWVKAQYSLKAMQKDHVKGSTLTLWRKPNVVAHQYPDAHITQVWEHVHQRVKSTRFFDAYSRGIEYQPGDKVDGRVDNDWDYRNQLLTPAFLATLSLQKTTGSGCNQQAVYTNGATENAIQLVWLPQLQLISSLSMDNNDKEKTTWTLVSLEHNQSDITAFFAQRNGYQTTDYADIGDDHTDPFLTNMVNQGFIEAGASGFYDTEGRAIGSHSHHH